MEDAKRPLLVLAAFALFLGVLLVPKSCGRDLKLIPEPERTVGPARHFKHFPLFFTGRRFDGYPFTGNAADDVRSYQRGTVTFLYGQCEIDLNSDEPRCGPPVQVQNWRACRKFPSNRGHVDKPLWLRLRGVPAAYYRRGDRLELYTRDTVISVARLSLKGVRPFAKQLRGVNVPIGRDQDLPRPLPSRFNGTAKRCPIDVR